MLSALDYPAREAQNGRCCSAQSFAHACLNDSAKPETTPVFVSMIGEKHREACMQIIRALGLPLRFSEEICPRFPDMGLLYKSDKNVPMDAFWLSLYELYYATSREE